MVKFQFIYTHTCSSLDNKEYGSTHRIQSSHNQPALFPSQLCLTSQVRFGNAPGYILSTSDHSSISEMEDEEDINLVNEELITWRFFQREFVNREEVGYRSNPFCKNASDPRPQKWRGPKQQWNNAMHCERTVGEHRKVSGL